MKTEKDGHFPSWTFPTLSLREFYNTPPTSRQAFIVVHLATIVSALGSHTELSDFRKSLTKMVMEPNRCMMLLRQPSRK